ncbi:MAG: hypothetical protein WAM71_19670 [Candidatus Korobacteraceae bacterium]
MKYLMVSLCFISILLLTSAAAAQNGAYSSYYTYTVSPNSDGSAYVTPTAEVTGIDDMSDWIEGQYRPVCSVKSKIQLPGDANWVLGQGWGLGHAVDQVHTGSAVYVPADGSTVGLDYSVRSMSGARARPTRPTSNIPLSLTSPAGHISISTSGIF